MKNVAAGRPLSGHCASLTCLIVDETDADRKQYPHCHDMFLQALPVKVWKGPHVLHLRRRRQLLKPVGLKPTGSCKGTKSSRLCSNSSRLAAGQFFQKRSLNSGHSDTPAGAGLPFASMVVQENVVRI